MFGLFKKAKQKNFCKICITFSSRGENAVPVSTYALIIKVINKMFQQYNETHKTTFNLPITAFTINKNNVIFNYNYTPQSIEEANFVEFTLVTFGVLKFYGTNIFFQLLQCEYNEEEFEIIRLLNINWKTSGFFNI